MKKIHYFFVNCGKILFIYSFLFLIAISLNSLTIRGKINYGNRCIVDFNENVIQDFKYNEVILKDYYLGCNTYYLSYSSTLKDEKEVLFLASLSKFLSDKNIESDIQVRIDNGDSLILASIINYQISYTKTIY